MIFPKILARLIHTTKPTFGAEKSNLALLRKKTGYTFSNCKKALELHNNDTTKAEAWLREQAQALGWTKATKLEGRTTTQGLIAVTVNKNNATLVELNCETDFVARNNVFQEMVQEVARVSLMYSETHPLTDSVMKLKLDSENLKNLKASDGKTLADHVALLMGTVGENVSLRRGLCIKSDPNIHLYGYAHPSGVSRGDSLLGRVGGVVAIRQRENVDVNLDEIGKSLCQHIVGMNPKKIGTVDDKPAKDTDDELCLIHQEFLEDPEVTVGQVLEENALEVVDFQRFECGESLDTEGGVKPLEFVETCQ